MTLHGWSIQCSRTTQFHLTSCRCCKNLIRQSVLSKSLNNKRYFRDSNYVLLHYNRYSLCLSEVKVPIESTTVLSKAPLVLIVSGTRCILLKTKCSILIFCQACGIFMKESVTSLLNTALVRCSRIVYLRWKGKKWMITYRKIP